MNNSKCASGSLRLSFAIIMEKKRNAGIKGEQQARRYYEERGFEILEVNYRHNRAEIDFIALTKDEKLLVFVEVKKRSRSDFGYPETFVSTAQQDRIKSAAEEYIYGINWIKDIRFDIVSVDSYNQLEVFEDAF